MNATLLNTPEYTVSELGLALKRTVENAYGYVRVRGEISGFKRATSGHLYLCLKDAGAVIDGVMWKGGAAALPFRPEDGLEVIATGKLTTYPGRSKYQIVIERMEPAGAGALMALLEARKAKLAAEGLFDPARKRALPYIPRVIGVITSPTGAVIRDILHRLSDRFPRRVLVWPVVVQGEAAAGQVAAAVAGFNALVRGGQIPRPDLLIVARGGGSVEDLWAFNEEIVVRAVAASTIPVITAVGHETDTTLVDFAGDHRAPTPTAAAERAVPVLADLRLTLGGLGLRLDRAAARGVELRAERATALARRLPTPSALLGLRQQRADELADRLPRALRAAAAGWRARYDRAGGALQRPLLDRRVLLERTRVERTAERLRAGGRALLANDAAKLGRAGAGLRPALLGVRRDRAVAALGSAARLLETLGPNNVLKRGYAYVTTRDGHVITSAGAARAKVALRLTFDDGTVDVTTGAASPPEDRPVQPSVARPAARPAVGGPVQERLL
ncbi:exodeoxyribonuclease VII large subunit [Polymorphobacter sp. PAMC 29334]|uniref:exodeoxyribonuclease VII large subunit n=1 Tax=Polymorphobacter sp. PAMC 29334 TaxID=2862331 RepID=UPI001C754F37|nr:exodeoxyribonuclease VII large subunit [Polymorphobacter sp. PAMC 29334]QYE36075.1 exodeoxyribonuclease VII large subunit [Polymorphobacter sp. PAMC 29334]